MTAVVGDYDGGEVSVDEAIARLSRAGISAIVYTTRRHRPDVPRWRVVAQLESPLSCDAYNEHLNILNGALGGILAPESWDLSRSYFYGKVDGVEYRSEEVQGAPIDVKAIEGFGWKPMGKLKNIEAHRPTTSQDPPNYDRAFERLVAVNEVNNRTMVELFYALEAVKDRAIARGTWNETFLAMVSLKGTEYDNQARGLIETWSEKHGTTWCEKEPDDTKWDRESSRVITYKSIFHWADEADTRRGVYETDQSWRAQASAALAGQRSSVLGINVLSYSDFCISLQPPEYVWHRVLQKGCLYALTAKWGHGKTAVMITVALFVATGRKLRTHSTEKQRVLYLCGENPEDVKLRVLAATLKFDIPTNELADQIFFTRRPFALDDLTELKQFIIDASNFGPFGLIVIDTGPAHSSAAEENDNREMHKLAMAMRELMAPLGNPATVALMHPTKEATRENLQPRGGGAFSGSIDGELCVWLEHGHVEFFHRTKFRGPGFESMWFDLERFELPGMKDNFDEPVVTVLAIESSSQASDRPARRKPLPGAAATALRALNSALADPNICEQPQPDFDARAAAALNCSPPIVTVHMDRWRNAAYSMGISDGDSEAKKKAFKRARERLIGDRLVGCWEDRYWVLGGQ